MIEEVISIFLHIDKHLDFIIGNYGALTYLILFAVIFFETGLVVTPFLPGDSLLFIAGTFASRGVLNIWVLYFSLFIAAIVGDSVNYFIGNYFGVKVFEKNRFFKPEYLEKTKEFYRKHGGKAVLLARFVPIMRTFAPFVAGIGKMNYRYFLFYNLLGGFIWTTLFIFGGYFFGNIQFVQENFSFVVIGIIFISILPIVRELIKRRKSN